MTQRNEIEQFWREVCNVSKREVLQKLVDHTVIWEVEAGEYLVHQGEEMTEVMILQEGLVKGYDEKEESHRIQLIVFQRGYFPFANDMICQNYASASFTVEALAPSKIVCVPVRVWQECVQKEPALIGILLKVINMHQSVFDSRRLVVNNNHNARIRVEWFLKEYAEVVKQIPKKDIANYLVIRPETLSRVLREIEKEKNKKQSSVKED